MTREVISFKKTVYAYYQNFGRDLPWRNTENHYHIFVSEIMLQQTQVARVLGTFERFVSELGDFYALAEARAGRLLSIWQGLGYNRRCIHLKESAVRICTEFSGKLPQSEDLLRSLPGVGIATSRALLAYCFNRPTVFIETNIRQVFIHFFFKDRKTVSDGEILPLVELTLDRRNPREWYYALMDYGSMLKDRVGNLTRRSAGYKRPARFEGSMRQLRGTVLKVLLKHKKITADTVAEMAGFDPEKVEEAIYRLEREGFLDKRGPYYSLRQ
jgi:A/G-specific adenine glycosylase